jgi:hypothetical protein
MRWITVLIVALAFMMASTPASAELIKGNVLFSDGRFDYATVTLGEALTDSILTYYSGSVPGYQGTLLYDPYNLIWVPGPIQYNPASLEYNGNNLRGWERQFGDGTTDSRFFFGKNGHVYQRVDAYRTNDEPAYNGRGSKGKGKGHDRGRGHHKVKTSSFWVDLADRNYGDLVYLMPGEQRPTQGDMETSMRDLWGYNYGNWQDRQIISPVQQDPISDENRISIGLSFTFNL